MTLFENVDNTIIREMALSLGLFIIVSVFITILIGKILNSLKVPNRAVRAIIGFVYLVVAYFTFIGFEKIGLFNFI